ncbi:hypothetical protein UO65_4685 [Actinokineospora spheciospongiae]|uniref:Uncharacterized protein n=1 Tax=Actinokineospora spheciospongiae TaxID=909613 RepID=W7ITE4_9PSEU|nr:hypothetical protein [Actinokineospora spheciospongiae]EWC60032.1 hypothetical protein UO65_4685 [Actinokineospora spheciospongiae]
MRRVLTVLTAVLGLVLATAPLAQAYEPVNVVHTERVQIGPYALDVGFSAWPVRAMQSLDWTFAPVGGIADKSGTLSMTAPDQGKEARQRPMARHPRKLEVWGLDIKSLDSPGNWTIRFRVDGPQGPGEGALTSLNVLDQPGPPMALSWSLSTLPLVGLVAFLAVAWRRTRLVAQ